LLRLLRAQTLLILHLTEFKLFAGLAAVANASE
jgi:hypothetical protein